MFDQEMKIDVWLASLGPVASALLEAAVRGAIRRTPPPPPSARKKEPRSVEGYELEVGPQKRGIVELRKKHGRRNSPSRREASGTPTFTGRQAPPRRV